MKQKKQYDSKKLFLQGLIAFGNFFQNVKWERSHLTRGQQRIRRAFKAARLARREQRRLQRGEMPVKEKLGSVLRVIERQVEE